MQENYCVYPLACDTPDHVLAKIDMDMKEEIERFMERGISPALFGPRIRNIPEIKSFRITSKKKSQQAEYDDFDFSGDTYETSQYLCIKL